MSEAESYGLFESAPHITLP